jgi:3D (Asp-Asp-Asp) domain-containing protein
VLPAALGAGATRSATELRAEYRALEARSTSALLELFALESRLAAARADAAAARSVATRLEAEHARARERVAVARRTAANAELVLADRLRTLYQAGDVHPLAILLGAATLDQAVTALDGLRFAAEQDIEILEQTKAARRALSDAERRTARRRVAAEAAAASARARAAALERAHEERLAYVQLLAGERELKRDELASLERGARAARAAAEALAAAPPADRSSPAAGEAPAPVAAGTVTVTATGYAIAGLTATGMPTGYGVVAVDPGVIPLGSRLTIPGYGEGVAADVGSSVRGHAIDLWFPSRAEALRWGRRTVTITIH